MARADFRVDKDKCVGCGTCLNVCPGNMVGGDVLRMEDGHPVMVDQNSYGWQGCWRCQHCLAACPVGAISIFGVDPEQVSGKPDPAVAGELGDLMRFRRTCRDFRKEDVDPEIIEAILSGVSAVPTGGNNQGLEFSVVYTRKAMKRVYEAMFGGTQLSLLEEEKEDFSALRIYDAPHLFIAHKEMNDRFHDGGTVEINMATAYFELLANAYGLGTVISTYAAEQLSQHKEVMALLEIPENHTFMTVVGFGYPKYRYARGIQKTRPAYRIR